MNPTTSSARRIYLSLLLLQCVVITILSHIPGDRYPSIDIPNIDKSVHILLYLPMGFFMGMILTCDRLLSNTRAIALWLLALILFAASDEIHQFFITNRTCDLWDFCFDVTGIVVGYFITLLIITKRYPGTNL